MKQTLRVARASACSLGFSRGLFALLLALTLQAAQIDGARAALNKGDLVNAEQMALSALDAAQHSKSQTAIDEPLDLLAQIYQREKKFPEAIAAEQQRIDLWTHQINENAVIVGRVLGQLANIEKQSGALADAETHSRRAFAIMAAAFPDQPAAAEAALDLAAILPAQDAEQMRAVAAKIYAPPTGVFNVGPGITVPRILQKVEPGYAEEARKAKLQGSILLRMVIDATGTPTQIVVLRPLGLGLDEKAIEAVQQWRFAPATRAGAPVPVQSQIEVFFRLL